MHTDEAVHADKFGLDLLEQGIYQYDPNEYHGPTLNYFTLIPAWLAGERTYAEIDEVTLRIVPVVFGTALILLIAGLAGGLGLEAVAAAVLAALSPAMVFYSRYYIQEMLLACFTLGLIVCGYRYVRTRSLVWALAAGGFADGRLVHPRGLRRGGYPGGAGKSAAGGPGVATGGGGRCAGGRGCPGPDR